MNVWVGMGRLTRDPELRTSQSGQTFANFSVAVSRRAKGNGPDADFFNCVAFDRTAEFVQKYFHKGNKIVIKGRLQNDSYTNRDGVKVTSTRIMVDEVDFAETRASAEQSRQDAPTQTAPAQAAPKSSADETFMQIPDNVSEELPFN